MPLPYWKRVRILSNCLTSQQYVSCFNCAAFTAHKKIPKLRLKNWKALGFRDEEINGQVVVMPRTEITTIATSLLAIFPEKTICFRNIQATFDAIKPFFKLQQNFVQDGIQGRKLSSKESNHSLPSEQGHSTIKTRNNTQDDETLVLHERKVSRFAGVSRIVNDTFRDTFDALYKKYEVEHDGRKLKEVTMVYPGGICYEKVGAYMTQSKEISNVQKLHSINFSEEHCQKEEKTITYCPEVDVDSKLSADGKVFKQKFINIETKTKEQQTKHRRVNAIQWMAAIPTTQSKYVSKRPCTLPKCDVHTRQFTSSQAIYKSIDDCKLQSVYAYENSSAFTDDALLRSLREETARSWPKAEQLIDEMQGKVLSFLLQTTKAYRALEIGCFTGYSAICLANGLVTGGSLVTCDIDASALQFAKRFFEKSSHADQIIVIQQDGLEYLSSVIKSTKAEHEPFDFIFIDANKRKYRAYYDFILKHRLLDPSGLLVFDNTLFRGRVAAYSGGSASSKERIARSLAEFNSYVAQDARTRQVVVPIWDGLTLIRHT